MTLASLGLEPGLRVRFRRDPAKRWQLAVLERREADGSLGLRDGKGAARAIPVELVEVECRGPRGARSWEPVPERAARTEPGRTRAANAAASSGRPERLSRYASAPAS